MEITKTVDLKNVLLLVTMKICRNIFQVRKIIFKEIVPVLFQYFLKVILQTRDIVRWRFPNTPFPYRHCIQAVIVFQWFFLQPTVQARLYYFRRICMMWCLPDLFCFHDVFTFQKYCTSVDYTFLVPNQLRDSHK